MEHHIRKRGISLIRHERKHSVQPEHTVTSRAPVTHFNYSRYPVSQMMVRQASTPKPSIHFSYPINHETSRVAPSPPPLKHNQPEGSRLTVHFEMKPPKIETTYLPTPLEQKPLQLEAPQLTVPAPLELKPIQHEVSHITSPTPVELNPTQFEVSAVEKFNTPKVPNQATDMMQRENNPENTAIASIDRYYSFEHCKEVIGNRIFGESPKQTPFSQKENLFGDSLNTKQTPSIIRQNRFQAQVTHPEIIPEAKISPFNEILNLPLEISYRLNIPVENLKEKETPKIKPKTLAQENLENIKIEPHGKETIKMRKAKRNPMNLQNMEQRLLEIIKICDETI